MMPDDTNLPDALSTRHGVSPCALQAVSAHSIIPCMRIAIGSDHAGYRLKTEILRHLSDQSAEVTDFGANGESRVDYPDIGLAVADSVASGTFDVGILVCGSGVGMSITANKVRGIRAALCGDTYSARMSRLHNDANVLTRHRRWSRSRHRGHLADNRVSRRGTSCRPCPQNDGNRAKRQ